MVSVRDDRKHGSYIHVQSGRQVDPLDLRAEDVDITDIAHALSNQCRFSGHTREFYSVAQHSVLVSWACLPEFALFGLLHDAVEAYLQDMARPLKHDEYLGRAYRGAERRAERVVFPVFGLPERVPEEVKHADHVVFATEVRDLFTDSPLLLRWVEHMDVSPQPEKIRPWTPRRSRREFLDRYKRLLVSRPGPEF